jgi:hypothetical protein
LSKDSQPRIVAERLLSDPLFGQPHRVQLLLLRREPRYLPLRRHWPVAGLPGSDIFDRRLQEAPFVVNRADSGRVTEWRPNFHEMLECARRLSRGWPCVRVDLSSASRGAPSSRR